MVNLGADYGEMQRLSTDFKTKAGDTSNLRNALQNTVNTVVNSGWKGQAANNFQTAWTEFNTALQKLEQALNEAAKEVDNRIQGYQAADSAG